MFGNIFRYSEILGLLGLTEEILTLKSLTCLHPAVQTIEMFLMAKKNQSTKAC